MFPQIITEERILLETAHRLDPSQTPELEAGHRPVDAAGHQMKVQVDAGDEMYKWLTDGSVDIQMAPDVVDDGKPLPPLLDVTWTLASGDADAVTIIDGDKELATMRITATGEYVFRLEVWDGDEGLPPTFDTVAVNVFDDACAAAKAQPGYAPLVSDLDDDCDTDLDDLNALVETWLVDYTLDDPTAKP